MISSKTRMAPVVLSIATLSISGCEPPRTADSPGGDQQISRRAGLEDSASSRPNILLVVADDMGWTDLGAFGSEIETPHIDQLAERGVQFTNFHTSVSCSPTRSMLLSGNDNHVAGLGNMGELLAENQVGEPGYEGHINERVATLAEVMSTGGYHTYMAGKWHLGHKPDLWPSARGFDRSLALLNGGASHWNDMTAEQEYETPAEYTMDGKKLDELPDDFYSTRSYTDFIIQAIRENLDDGRPFLAYLSPTSPHDPVHVPEPWLSMHRGQYDEGYEALKERRAEAAREAGLVSPNSRTPDRHPLIKPWDSLSEDQKAVEARGMEVYAGMVSNLDYHIGRVFDFLKDAGAFENTIVLFMSDNGANPWYSVDYPHNHDGVWIGTFDNSLDNIGHPGSHYAYGIGFASASEGPLARFKMTVSEGGTRGPLLIAGPGITRGKRTDAFAYVWDVMPTILDLAEVDHPGQMRGRPVEAMRGKSMASLLEGSADRIYDDDELIAAEMGGGRWVRQGDFKAVSVPPRYGDGEWHLYDISADPGETTDLSKEQPGLLEKLTAAWDDYAAEVGVVLPE